MTIQRLTAPYEVAGKGTECTYLVGTRSGSVYHLVVPRRSRGRGILRGGSLPQPVQGTVGGILPAGMPASEHSTIISEGKQLYFGYNSKPRFHTTTILRLYDVTTATPAEIEKAQSEIAAIQAEAIAAARRRSNQEAPPVTMTRR